MSDDNPGNSNEGSGRKSPEPQTNWRGFMLFAMALILVLSALMINTATTRSTRITYERFKEYVQSGQIDTTKDLELIRQDTSAEEFIRGY